MSGGAIHGPSANDGDGIQGLLTRLGIVTRKFYLSSLIYLLLISIFRNKFSKKINKYNTETNWKC
jgi:hypothetical protein